MHAGSALSTQVFGNQSRRIVDARPCSARILGQQAAPDGERTDAHDLSVVDQCELGGPASHIDVQQALAPLSRKPHSA